ncbi:MAG: hypothetical protein QOE06_3674 [Thermoleophilaceae bacterium]|nr:hypothetical protein [Thermoleophilaceae bacterium]
MRIAKAEVKDKNTHDELAEDSGVCVDCKNGEQEFDFISFDLLEVICADEEAGVEWGEEGLRRDFSDIRIINFRLCGKGLKYTYRCTTRDQEDIDKDHSLDLF